MPNNGSIDLEDLVITAYCALDDALKHAGVVNNKGKLFPRRGPPPEVDDREILCLCLLQEWLGFESDLSFYEWFENNKVMCDFFPKETFAAKLDRPAYTSRPLLERDYDEQFPYSCCRLYDNVLVRLRNKGWSVY